MNDAQKMKRPAQPPEVDFAIDYDEDDPCTVELSISTSPEDWQKLVSQPFFGEMIAWMFSLQKEKEGMK